MSNINVQKLEPYKSPFCVWKLIESLVPPSELVLVKMYIGESSIEYCIDLRNELEILLDIWREVGERIEPPTVTKNLVNSLLPDPPQLKEMLTKEIQLLVKEIQERNGSISDSKYEDREKKVIQYAMLSQKSERERPSTPLRKPGRDKPSSTPMKLKQVKQNMTVTNIDDIADMLREAIQKECKQLEADIEFLQNCVEEEHEVTHSRSTSPIEEPSLAQLRQVCRTLETKAHSRKTPPTSSSNLPTTAKLPTPPSPQRVQLKPIEASDLPSTSNRPLPRRLTKSKNLEQMLENDFGVQESWLEPSWTQCMSDSLPPSTGDSGVSSRPGTCEISARRERRKEINETENLKNTNMESASSFSIDVGYQSNSSTDLTNSDLLHVDSQVTYSADTQAGQNHTVPRIPSNLSPSISPHPPKENAMKITRKNVSARIFSRKMFKIS